MRRHFWQTSVKDRWDSSRSAFPRKTDHVHSLCFEINARAIPIFWNTVRVQKSSRSDRALRGAVAALFATMVALCSHVLAGGQVPDLLGVMLPLAVSVQVCILLSGRRFSIFRLSLAVAFSQFFFHGLFSLGAGQSNGTAMAAQHEHLMHTATTTSPIALEASHLTHGDPMLLAHVVAAIATVLVLHRGESILFSLAGLVDLFFLGLLRFLIAAIRIPVVSRRPLVRRTEPLAFISAVYVNCVARRGPPALLLV
ncbi:hypothetical protein [Paeniglutamicibacter sp. NPDC091659]|uniref:hypothetical protein n=1 Tax=Paeniglutamicibacter sp. NPDC091659 TaxID=3364389 RepID=UPI0038062281